MIETGAAASETVLTDAGATDEGLTEAAARAPLTIAGLIAAIDDDHVKRSLSNVYVSRRYGYVFVSNPKAACSSIKHKLFELESPAAVRWRGKISVHAQEFSPLLGLAHFLGDEAAADPVYSFCITRNPFTRLYSAFTDKIGRDRPHKRQIARALGRPEGTPGADFTFRDFVTALTLIGDADLDGHWGVQAERLHYTRFTYSFTGAFETLAEDLPRALTGAGVPAAAIGALGRRNRTRPEATLTEVMDAETADMIRTRYAADFTAFGYSEDPAEATAPPAARTPL